MKKAFLYAIPAFLVASIYVYYLFGMTATPSWLVSDELKTSDEFSEVFQSIEKIQLMFAFFGGCLAFIGMFFTVIFLEENY